MAVTLGNYIEIGAKAPDYAVISVAAHGDGGYSITGTDMPCRLIDGSDMVALAKWVLENYVDSGATSPSEESIGVLLC